MIIVSQDKLRTSENMELMMYPVYEDIDNLKIECYKIQNDLTWLGYYKTEERAKEVLQEIIERYTNWENFKMGQSEGICSPKYEMPLE